jgi:excisionase family DNA binding protein
MSSNFVRTSPTLVNRQLLTIDEVASLCSLGRTKIYELVRSGEIESVKVGAARRITPAAVAAFIQRLQAAV